MDGREEGGEDERRKWKGVGEVEGGEEVVEGRTKGWKEEKKRKWRGGGEDGKWI